ncbi:uncharacterized protein PADG_11759 [Paracoccidioides brasiliensis Pb18]|uniref:Uncharacterized protein n=1 Tax=Paracoccidioides brasiliensis (strain Pb18) TaxID=502780 RepID=A0A0A0HW30_PARBD|nr:uncharacterized protein PADG_11759 [Paracoccidioides brasiliensis Pb18]KGM92221.1 hypothetical protein PADG_11759 [Paracoccidioides brasiliensis Pb18]
MTCIDASFAPDRISSKQLVGMALRAISFDRLPRSCYYARTRKTNTSIDKYHPVSDLGENPRGAAEDSPALFHAQMYAIGEKFGISGLKSLAKEKLEGDGDIHLIWCGRTFYSVVQVIYGTTYSGDRGLRDVIVGFAHQNITALKTRLEFEETLEEFPSFTRDLLWRMIGEDRQEEGERLTVDPTPDYHVRETT